MFTFFAGIFRRTAILAIFFSCCSVAGLSQSPAIVSGIVTNSLTNAAVTGAKISAGTYNTLSVFGGVFTLSLPAGSYTITCAKAGFTLWSSNPVTLTSGTAVSLPVSLIESANLPYNVISVPDSTATPPVVNISWQAPRGDYELLYDDGIQDDFTVWSVQGNLNAVRFTPLAYPLSVTGGKVNIGAGSNYPSGSTPLVPFQISVYDAGGPNGMPGTRIGSPVDVIPTALGWVDFTINPGITINSGYFYLVMTQGGNAPNAAGLAIDQTYPQFRSYSKFVTSGSTNWMPAAGNFMMRALVNGSGGPGMLLNDAPQSVTGYSISRLRQGEEQNPSIWTHIATLSSTNTTDNLWSSLPCGPYRWAAQASYSANQYSDYAFSNVIGKCWTVTTTVRVSLSCDSTARTGISVGLVNLVYPDTVYQKLPDTSGVAIFRHFWKGSYQLKVSRFGYQDFLKNVSISMDTSIDVLLLQNKTPPSGLIVNDSNLFVKWNKPLGSFDLFTENWQSGSFSTNSWSVQGQNWGISSGIGNPAPSAIFNWAPQGINYQQSLLTRSITGTNSAVLKLQYDIFLDDYGTTSLNQMTVEIWDGVNWNILKNYTNSMGDIPWTSQNLDISSYSGTTFKIRFRANGADSYDINNWNIDNIRVQALESSAVAGDCVLGYNVYLNNILCGSTPDTFYQIPSFLVQYGLPYTTCIAAVYGSGTSTQVCDMFNSAYLPPPLNLQGASVDDAAYLNWAKPSAKKKSGYPNPADPPGLMGYVIFKNGVYIDSVRNADSLRYADYSLYPATYHYKVSAYYDLAAYGFPGSYAQSYPDGPVAVDITYGRHLPFTETWDQENFADNGWEFDPSPGNWSIISSYGNPMPEARFSSDPAATIYSYSLVSPVLNASSLTCANIWLDFDYRLLDKNSTGNEKLFIEAYYNDLWHQIEVYSNNGGTSWIPKHLNITPVKGRAFRIRFRASGINSGDIENWNLDNIHVYGVCKPPSDLTGTYSGYDVTLTWTPPECEDGNPMVEGFEETFFPPADWTVVTTNVNNKTWEHTSSSTPAGVHSGGYAAGLTYDYSHQDEWLIAHDILISDNLHFWSYAFQGSVHLDHYYVKLSEDQGATWQIIFDLSSLPPYPSISGYNEWQVPYTIDLTSHLGQVVDLAWEAVDGDGQGLWFAWLIDDCSVGSKKISMTGAAEGGNYEVFRQDGGEGNYNLISQRPVNDTTYKDNGLVPDIYRYYVTSWYQDCSVMTPSDTVLINIVTGVNPVRKNNTVEVFPNPASDFISVHSSFAIQSIEVLNYLGQRVLDIQGNHHNNESIDVSSLPQGVYFFCVTSGGNQNTLKVMIFR